MYRWSSLHDSVSLGGRKANITPPGANITITPTTNTTNVANACDSDTISGTLTISPSYTGAVHIPSIQEITGDVTLTDAAGVTDLVLPDLQSIGGTLRVSGNEALRNVSLGQLESAGNQDSGMGGLAIRENKALETVGLGSLKDVYGGLTLEGGFRFVKPIFTLDIQALN